MTAYALCYALFLMKSLYIIENLGHVNAENLDVRPILFFFTMPILFAPFDRILPRLPRHREQKDRAENPEANQFARRLGRVVTAPLKICAVPVDLGQTKCARLP